LNDKAVYIAGDSSGRGFGAYCWVQDSKVVDVNFG